MLHDTCISNKITHCIMPAVCVLAQCIEYPALSLRNGFSCQQLPMYHAYLIVVGQLIIGRECRLPVIYLSRSPAFSTICHSCLCSVRTKSIGPAISRQHASADFYTWLCQYTLFTIQSHSVLLILNR